jgi:GTPase involved in cell partitioning and DNA repair
MTRGPAMAAHRVVLHVPIGVAFEQNVNDQIFDLSRDGQRFLINTQGIGDRSGDLVIVENFMTELRTALAAGKAE